MTVRDILKLEKFQWRPNSQAGDIRYFGNRYRTKFSTINYMMEISKVAK